MKRSIIALLVGGLVFGVVFGVASLLSVDGGVVQGGESSMYCDPDGVEARNFNVEMDTMTFDKVKIKGIHADCVGERLFVKIYDDAAPTVQIASCTVASIANVDEVCDFGSPVNVMNADIIRVLIQS